MPALNTHNRVDWVDYSKGICIILVVMMHSVLGYGEMVGAEGWMHPLVAFAKPFRMPDFFLISGLFLSRSLFGNGASYFDRKIVHFAYFYVLWLAIQTAAFEAHYLLSDPVQLIQIFAKALIVPNGSLWFVHMLAVFYAVTWALRHVPRPVVFGAAVLAQTAFAFGLVDTGWSVTNRLAEWFVYFYAGYAGAGLIFSFASHVAGNLRLALGGLAVWAVFNLASVEAGISALPGIGLMLGFVGAAAIIAVGSILAQLGTGRFLHYAGRHSIVIYLTFFIPMKITQKGLAITSIIPDVGTASAVAMLAGLLGPLVFHRMIAGTPLVALYERPAWARMQVRASKLKQPGLLEA